MLIYMRHPRHGNKIAIAELEALQDEENGWERYDPGALLTPKEPIPEVVVEADSLTDLESPMDELEFYRQKYKDKFGKKPHHKKGVESLKKELEG